ncbi:Accessory gene regulator B [Paenibacillus sp. FSL R7-277]|uniref:accessory gene regulator B family protein n=1 Tax=Paenibacillus sp. FSL R7-277 TaxID=1227352 RepID=UPI0003E27B5C|nr:Accessory gene regulator B [Paenibacillus sp. FSL R7-277]
MNTLCFKIASMIKRANPQETSSIEIMQYSLSIILNSLLIIFISFFIGWSTGSIATTAIALFGFAILRFISGGKHLKSATACNIISIILCSSLPHITFLSEQHFILINMFSLIIIVIFAPNPDANVHVPLRYYPLLKVLSVLMVSSNLFIQSHVLGLAFFAQSLTIISLPKKETVK